MSFENCFDFINSLDPLLQDELIDVETFLKEVNSTGFIAQQIKEFMRQETTLETLENKKSNRNILSFLLLEYLKYLESPTKVKKLESKPSMRRKKEIVFGNAPLAQTKQEETKQEDETNGQMNTSESSNFPVGSSSRSRRNRIQMELAIEETKEIVSDDEDADAVVEQVVIEDIKTMQHSSEQVEEKNAQQEEEPPVQKKPLIPKKPAPPEQPEETPKVEEIVQKEDDKPSSIQRKPPVPQKPTTEPSSQVITEVEQKQPPVPKKPLDPPPEEEIQNTQRKPPIPVKPSIEPSNESEQKKKPPIPKKPTEEINQKNEEIESIVSKKPPIPQKPSKPSKSPPHQVEDTTQIKSNEKIEENNEETIQFESIEEKRKKLELAFGKKPPTPKLKPTFQPKQEEEEEGGVVQRKRGKEIQPVVETSSNDSTPKSPRKSPRRRVFDKREAPTNEQPAVQSKPTPPPRPQSQGLFKSNSKKNLKHNSTPTKSSPSSSSSPVQKIAIDFENLTKEKGNLEPELKRPSKPKKNKPDPKKNNVLGELQEIEKKTNEEAFNEKSINNIKEEEINLKKIKEEKEQKLLNLKKKDNLNIEIDETNEKKFLEMERMMNSSTKKKPPPPQPNNSSSSSSTPSDDQETTPKWLKEIQSRKKKEEQTNLPTTSSNNSEEDQNDKVAPWMKEMKLKKVGFVVTDEQKPKEKPPVPKK